MLGATYNLQTPMEFMTLSEDNTESKDKLQGTGYSLDAALRNEETNVFHDPPTQRVTMAYRGTARIKPSE